MATHSVVIIVIYLQEYQGPQRNFFIGYWSLEDDFASLDRYLKYIRIDSMKETLTEIFTMCKNALQQSLPSLKRCFIHGDINPGNILLSQSLSNNSNHKSTNQADATHQPLWLIDFGDFHYGYIVIELGIAVAHIIAESTTDGITNSGHFLAGYLSIAHLDAEEFNLIYDITFARLFQLIVLCEYSYTFNPNNNYIIDRVPQYFQAITKLQNFSRKEIYQIWSEIIHPC